MGSWIKVRISNCFTVVLEDKSVCRKGGLSSYLGHAKSHVYNFASEKLNI